MSASCIAIPLPLWLQRGTTVKYALPTDVHLQPPPICDANSENLMDLMQCINYWQISYTPPQVFRTLFDLEKWQEQSEARDYLDLLCAENSESPMRSYFHVVRDTLHRIQQSRLHLERHVAWSAVKHNHVGWLRCALFMRAPLPVELGMRACKYHSVDCLRFLWKKGAVFDGWTVHAALLAHADQCLLFLMQKHISPLHHALRVAEAEKYEFGILCITNAASF